MCQILDFFPTNKLVDNSSTCTLSDLISYINSNQSIHQDPKICYKQPIHQHTRKWWQSTASPWCIWIWFFKWTLSTYGGYFCECWMDTWENFVVTFVLMLEMLLIFALTKGWFVLIGEYDQSNSSGMTTWCGESEIIWWLGGEHYRMDGLIVVFDMFRSNLYVKLSIWGLLW